MNKVTLNRRNREDFLEIFYLFLILKAIERFNPDSISFTCKDAIDTGAAENGTFYGFLKLLNNQLVEKEDWDCLLWLLYTPALFIRERAIDPERFNRAISALDRLDMGITASKGQIASELSALFSVNGLLDVKALPPKEGSF